MLDDNPELVLENCLNAVFAVANEQKISSIALPSIGTGVFKFPIELCASITAKVIKANAGRCVQLVRVCVTDAATQAVFMGAVKAEGILQV